MDSKPFYASKVFWVNFLTMLIAIVSLVQESAVLPPDAAKYLLLGVGVLNIVLRVWFSAEPLTLFRK